MKKFASPFFALFVGSTLVRLARRVSTSARDRLLIGRRSFKQSLSGTHVSHGSFIECLPSQFHTGTQYLMIQSQDISHQSCALYSWNLSF
ncbi:hypothetical protein B0H34DRAFT_378577 [Crassisporium funariophilum]|nr:hypothetical protein B0H34DRAFT_378577 [Crassisporium funariophilum]